ncbi:MAG TPA: asparagine synthase-related protein [Thermoplasmata archaeon]|nr:asparagine synthase-related protein [Thermoplasmata archaeon]
MDTESGPYGPLDRALDAALGPLRSAGAPRVVLFSGGVDSGLLAWELRRSGNTVLFTVGLPPSADLARAAAAAPLVGLPWSSRRLDEPLLGEAEALVEHLLPDLPSARRSVLVALAAAMIAAPPGRLVCGQGADELFLGYAHFRGLSTEAAEVRSRADLQQLLDRDAPALVALAAEQGRQVDCPYLDRRFVEAAGAVPVEMRMPGVLPKGWFREFARHRGLPAALADAPKKAIQYGSGVARWRRRRSAAAA